MKFHILSFHVQLDISIVCCTQLFALARNQVEHEKTNFKSRTSMFYILWKWNTKYLILDFSKPYCYTKPCCSHYTNQQIYILTIRAFLLHWKQYQIIILRTMKFAASMIDFAYIISLLLQKNIGLHRNLQCFTSYI